MNTSDNNNVDYYTTLPRKTTKFLQLRFKLVGFPGVYRTVKLPHNYTFAHLHTLILFLFGWNGSHSHRFEAYTHVEKYSESDEDRNGEMKRYGHPTPPPHYITTPAGPNYEREKHFWDLRTESAAFYEVVPTGTNKAKRQRQQKKGTREASQNRGVAYVKSVEDREITLGDVWNSDKEKNMSSGECNNEELGVSYEYDLQKSWKVHITLDREDDFFIIGEPRNLPIVMEAEGAPPAEDGSDLSDMSGELEPSQDEVSELYFDGRVFEKYCNGELYSSTGEKDIAISSKSRAPTNTQVGGYRLNDID